MRSLVDQPLTRSQHLLRGRKITDMTVQQLREWMDACVKMERWPSIEAKARRGWKASRLAAQAELERRGKSVGDTEMVSAD